MNKKRILLYILITITFMVNLFPGISKPVNAFNPLDYFTFSYDISLDTQEVHTHGFFYATVTGRATCIEDLPLTPSEAYVTGRVVARHIESGSQFILNSGYTVSLDSFPTKAGETFQATQEVPLFFPSSCPSGIYELTGELIEARFKAILWFTVTQYLPQYEAIGQIVFLPSTSSSDGVCTISFSGNSTARDGSGNPITELTFNKEQASYSPPVGYFILGDIYNIGPDGIVFSPSVTFTMEYDATLIPKMVGERKLVIATWNETLSQWTILPNCMVNSFVNEISTSINHLSLFAVLAPLEPLPAFFVVSNLTITPSEINVGDAILVSVTVFNSGEVKGEYEVILKLNEKAIESRLVSLPGGSSEVITFVIIVGSPDDYTIDFNGLEGFFTVYDASLPLPASFTVSDLSISPSEIKKGETVSIGVTVSNIGELEGEYELVLKLNGDPSESKLVTLAGGSSEVVTFDVKGGNSGEYSVDVNDLGDSFKVSFSKQPISIPEDKIKEIDWLTVLIYTLNILLLVFIIILARRWFKGNRSAGS